jgi:hypothetical protein
LDKPEGPDWKAFGRALAIAELRILGLAPVPPELQEQVEKIRRERMADQEPAAS